MKKKRETVKPGLRTGRNGNQSGAPPGAAEWPNRFPRFHFQVVRPSKAPPQQNEISKETMNAPPALPQHFAATCSFISLSIYLSIYLSLFLFRLEVFHFFLSIDFWAFNDSPPTLCGSLLHQQFYGFPFYGISLSINGLNWVLPSFYGSYWLLLCFTGFCV